MNTTNNSRRLIGLSSMIALAAFSVAAFGGNDTIRATVDGTLVNFPGVQPMMVNGRVMVPVRGVFEHMNATVVWDPNARTVTADHGNDSIKMQVNSYYATVNGNEVSLDSPVTSVRGRTLVPLRFISESLRANVEWLSPTRTVEITTVPSMVPAPVPVSYNMVKLEAGTVIPFKLVEKLTSNGSKVGDLFTANVDAYGTTAYQGALAGAILEGHVDTASAKTGDTPGVLGLAFHQLKMPDGQAYSIYGSLIGLDSKSVENKDGRLIAKLGAKNDDLKYVGYGAGGGALVAILTKGNVLTTTLIGAALGYLYSEIKQDPSRARDVTLEPGSSFGVRLTRDFSYRVVSKR